MSDHWKKKAEVQKRTFTNWFNDRLRGNLKVAKSQVTDLYEDLKDGLLLIALCEQLAKPRKLPRYNKRVINKIQAIENLGFVLKFAASENIKLVNIGPEDLYEGNPKLILGLVWTLIGRYQIRSSGRSLSTKAALKEWLDTLIPEYGIQNFSTDWNDGRPLCGLVDCLKPGLCPNHRSLNPNNGLENCRKGMELAEEHLNVPRLLDPEDMNNPEVDDLSVMTYIAYFFDPAMEQLLEWIRKKIPKKDVKNLSTDWNNGTNLAALIEACHPGLCPNAEDMDPRKVEENLATCIKIAEDRLNIKCPVKASALADPKVDEIVVATYLSRFKYSKLLASADEVIFSMPTFEHGSGVVKQPVNIEADLGSTPLATLQQLAITIKPPNSAESLPFKISEPKNSNATVTFIPQVSGKHVVDCILNDDQVTGCPLEIPVVDPATWRILGDIPEVMQVNKPVNLQVEGECHGSTPVISCEAYIDTGRKEPQPTTAEPTSSDNEGDNTGIDDPSSGTGEGNPPSEDNDGKQDTDLVEPPTEDSIVSGLDKPAYAGEEFSFVVKPDQPGEVDVLIQGPAISYTPEIEEVDDHYDVNFVPEEVGPHSVEVSIGKGDVKGSPFKLQVIERMPEEEMEANNDADGKPSDENNADGQTALEEDDLTSKEGDGSTTSVPHDPSPIEESSPPEEQSTPEEPPMEKAPFVQSSVSNVQPGKYNMYILPTDTGKAKVHVTVGGIDVQKSPFGFTIVDGSKCYMTDLENKIFLCEHTIEFDVFANRESAVEPLVSIQGPTRKYQSNVELKEDGEMMVYHHSFVPREPGVVKISVQLAGDHIPQSPCTIQVSDPSIISEIPKYVEVGKVYTFDVLIDDYIKEEPMVIIDNPKEATGPIIEASIYKNETLSNNWKLILRPLDPGTAGISVKLWQHHIKKSPFSVRISAISQCRVEGMDKPLRLGQPFPFELFLDEGLSQKPEVKVDTPSTKAVLNGVDNGDGTQYSYMFTPNELGTVKIAILFGGQDIPGSPFTKQVEFTSEAKNCVAYGPALHPNAVLQTGRPIEFCVDTTKAGDGELQVVAKGPKKEQLKVLVAEEDGIHSLRIDAPFPGKYRIHVWWSQVYIPMSPFSFRVHQISDPTKVRVYGSGVGGQIEVGRPAEFIILTKDAGMGTLTVNVYGIKDAFKVDVKPEDPSDPRTLKGVYHPEEAGDYRVIVKWSGNHVPGSPFPVTITDKRLEIEMARVEERRKERIKRVKSQQEILEKQTKLMQQKLESMPDFKKQAPLMMGKGGQFAGAVGGGEKRVEKVTVQRQRKKMVRHASSSAAATFGQSQSLTDIKGARTRKVSAPNKLRITEPKEPSTSKKKSSSSHNFESAMQKNAGMLGVRTPIGGSLKGGVTPMWLKDFSDNGGQPDSGAAATASRTNPISRNEDVKPSTSHHPPVSTTPVNYDNLPEDVPVSIQPLYDTIPDEDVQLFEPAPSKTSGKKKKKIFGKKR